MRIPGNYIHSLYKQVIIISINELRDIGGKNHKLRFIRLHIIVILAFQEAHLDGKSPVLNSERNTSIKHERFIFKIRHFR